MQEQKPTAEEAAAKAAEARAKSPATIGHLDVLSAEIERIKRILRNHSIGE